MPKVRFIGAEPSIVPFLNRNVEPDEVVNLTDEQYAAREWEVPDVWTVVADKPSKNNTED